MCGIIAYIGTKRSAKGVLINGLKKLEYRGYDSAGVAYLHDGKVVHQRAVGEVKNLENKLDKHNSEVQPRCCDTLQIGIAHTRWATHGKPTIENAHPHNAGDIYLVHNGIIENYLVLRAELTALGREFISETDSEVLAHLIDIEYEKEKNLPNAITLALHKVRGAYAIAVMGASDPSEIVLARKSSPIVLGIGGSGQECEYIVASDASAVLPYTKRVVYLDDGDVVSVRAGGYKVVKGTQKEEAVLEWSQEEAQLGGFEHFMSKEIAEQPEVIQNAFRGRMVATEGKVVLGGISDVLSQITNANRIIITSCGTSYNAGLVAEYLIESLAGIPVEVEYASEFRYRNVPLSKDDDQRDVVLAISQSGETADTLAAVMEAKRRGALTLGIVNIVGSTIARETDAGVYNHAGPEVSVASTKAFSSQLTVLTLLAVLLGREVGKLSKGRAVEILTELEQLPAKVGECIVSNQEGVEQLAKKYAGYTNMLYLGRHMQMPLALEGALKIKEIAYVHAEGYAAGEMKHGPIALVDEDMPCVVLAPRTIDKQMYEKSLAVIEEVKARGGKVLAITTKDATEVLELADDIILVPNTIDELMPLLTIVPMQLFAYYSAIERGHNVDRPRNLAKSVTVE